MNLPNSLLVLLALALAAWYLSFSASRLDRLHHRVEGARSALDAQLVRRAEAALELATSGAVDPASGLLLVAAATQALEAGEHTVALADQAPARERAESDLSQALRATLDDERLAELAADPLMAPLVERLGAACHRAQLARRFLNGAVTDARRVRRKGVASWLRLAGRAPLPQTVELDDEPPAGLAI